MIRSSSGRGMPSSLIAGSACGITADAMLRMMKHSIRNSVSPIRPIVRFPFDSSSSHAPTRARKARRSIASSPPPGARRASTRAHSQTISPIDALRVTAKPTAMNRPSATTRKPPASAAPDARAACPSCAPTNRAPRSATVSIAAETIVWRRVRAPGPRPDSPAGITGM